MGNYFADTGDMMYATESELTQSAKCPCRLIAIRFRVGVGRGKAVVPSWRALDRFLCRRSVDVATTHVAAI